MKAQMKEWRRLLQGIHTCSKACHDLKIVGRGNPSETDQNNCVMENSMNLEAEVTTGGSWCIEDV